MKIVGILLVKNEDKYIDMVIKNITDFCDEIIILDNYSADDTWNKILGISSGNNKIFCKQITDSLTSHSYIEKYAGTDTWIFGVDGDEIYDSKGLIIMKQKLLNHEYDKWWSIRGNCIHIEKIDSKNNVTGYETPPARSVTKLFNFSLISSWHEKKSERLHGNGIVYNNLFDSNFKNLNLFNQYAWDTSFFRCEHLCFVARSSLEDNKARFNPTESSKMWFSVFNFFRNLRAGEISLESSYKIKNYRVGQRVLRILNFLLQ